jgi:cell fate regulator YaaT (PSP1 superfamily)
MQIAKIRLRKPTRVYTFLCNDVELKRHDTCIVKSDRGLEYGTCILPPEPCPEGMDKRFKMNVLRRTTHNDESTFLQLKTQETKAKTICADKIKERNLAMKLVDVEYTFDKNKVIFYFTAEDRVDFRELVRDLAQDLKARIELRHIQVRDEAKITGGLGVCGRELCCATWMSEFKPISMKMAKQQNLSLNPSKISGQCGRLLCCLSYENEMYKERRAAEREAMRRAKDAQADSPADEKSPLSAAPVDPTAKERPKRDDRPRRGPRRDNRGDRGDRKESKSRPEQKPKAAPNTETKPNDAPATAEPAEAKSSDAKPAEGQSGNKPEGQRRRRGRGRRRGRRGRGGSGGDGGSGAKPSGGGGSSS